MKAPPKRLRLRLRPTAETLVRNGHPWVFSDSIKDQNRDGAAGELAVIFDRNDRFLAVGFYDPESPIRVRIIHAGKPVEIDSAFWKKRFDEALAKRNFGPETAGYRIIHGENDGFPGLVLDRYEDTFVLKIYSSAWLSRIEELKSLIPGTRLILRQSRNLADKSEILRGPPITEPVIFRENNIRFEADVLRGQKTGFFLDQRENRQVVESLSRDRDVLNTFSFSGGFSLYAARGRAKSVTDLDISAHALESSQRNFALNPSITTPHEAIQADTFEWLAQKPTRQFDLIVLDPPSLAKRESEKAGALRAYKQLAASAVPWLRPNGILVAASCSAHVKPNEFFNTINDVAASHNLSEFKRAGNPSDHPATFPEAHYLKAMYLRRNR